LRHPDQFQGARYELLATSACIRAGFDIRLENETDTSRKHPEFEAVDRQTGASIWVEAKSRHRSGILGRSGRRIPDAELKADITQLLDSALAKAPSGAFVIFIDLNLPPSDCPSPEQRWFGEIISGAESYRDAPFSMVLFTNFAYHYSEGNEPAPPGTALAQIPVSPKVEVNQALLWKLFDATLKAGNFPSKDFPDNN
jgi:hypothetical protein